MGLERGEQEFNSRLDYLIVEYSLVRSGISRHLVVRIGKPCLLSLGDEANRLLVHRSGAIESFGAFALIDIGLSNGSRLSANCGFLDTGFRLRRFDGHDKLLLVLFVDQPG